MAGDWIKMRGSLVTSPKVIVMADVLFAQNATSDWLTTGFHGPPGEVVTHNALRYVTVTGLLRVWSTANEHSKGGFLRGLTIASLDEMAGIPCFGEAMEAVGWAIFDEKRGGVLLPNFDEYNTCAEDRSREKNRERQKRYREKRKPAAELRNVTRNVTCNDREEKRREESNTPCSPPFDAIVFPDGLDTPDTRAAIAEWLDYRRHSGKPYKQPARQIAKLLKQFQTAEAFCAAVEHSIAQGYQGCFPPGGKHATPKPSPAQRYDPDRPCEAL